MFAEGSRRRTVGKEHFGISQEKSRAFQIVNRAIVHGKIEPPSVHILNTVIERMIIRTCGMIEKRSRQNKIQT